MYKKFFIFTPLLIFLDQLTKFFISQNPKTTEIIENFFRITYSENSGIAFGIKIPFPLLIILNFVLLGLIFYIAKKELKIEKNITQISLILIIAGGIGNLIDRISKGFVVDFISIWRYPTFNFADIYISIGVLLLIVFYGKIRRV